MYKIIIQMDDDLTEELAEYYFDIVYELLEGAVGVEMIILSKEDVRWLRNGR